MRNMEMIADAYDVVTIGAGPAGCAAATIVADGGLSSLLIEREVIPRFHVGESLMPETYDILQRLGVWDRLQTSDFNKKYSVQFVSGGGQESAPFFFEEHDPRERSQTFSMPRAEFDKLLFDNAAQRGAVCRDGVRVLDVLFDGGRATGVRLRASSGETKDVAATVVIDATGQHALIASRLGLKVEDPKLKKAAIWTYYRHARRDEGKHGGATIILHTADKKFWFWFIPIDGAVTSVGCVGDHEDLLKADLRPADMFERQVENCPGLLPRLAGAERVDKHRVAKEFSYTTTRHAGDGWVLVGDAFGFIDPIYSSGVYFALKSSEMAADCVVEAIRAGDTSAERLARWTAEFEHGIQWVRKLVDAYYDESFSIGQFMKAHPEHRGGLVDILIGRIFHDGAGRIFDDMDPWIQSFDPEPQATGSRVNAEPQATESV